MTYWFEMVQSDEIKSTFNYAMTNSPEVFCKKVVLKNFIKFTGEHLCQSLFLNKVGGLKLYEKRGSSTVVFL